MKCEWCLRSQVQRFAEQEQTIRELQARVAETEESFNTVSRICGEVLLERDGIREQCAKIAESYYNPKESDDFILARIEIAAAIRSGK